MSSSIEQRIQSDIENHPVILFMKGTALMPMCGFSATAVSLVQKHCGRFATRNVLEDPELREGIKAFSSWPTIPQLYVNGEFIGGCDIIAELDQEGELASILATTQP